VRIGQSSYRLRGAIGPYDNRLTVVVCQRATPRSTLLRQPQFGGKIYYLVLLPPPRRIPGRRYGRLGDCKAFVMSFSLP
jgi:hypothetical protein